MAYDVNTDYSALQAELKKQMAATTDATKKAALQAQFDAYEQSRNEKIASDLNKYGQYATDAQLNSAAGIQAENQIGTTYETQKQQLQDYYAQSKQNANNDALSRGMARSSFVSDRLSNLDSDLASGLSAIDASKATAVEAARANILDNYRTNAANELASKRSDARDQISTILGTGSDTVSDSLWANSGYDASTIAALKAALTQQAATDTEKYNGDPNPGGDIYSKMYAAGVGNSAAQAKAWLISQGYTSTQAEAYTYAYLEKYDNGDFNPQPEPNNTTTNNTQTAMTAQNIRKEISLLRSQGMTPAQIQQNAQQAYLSGAITGQEYQMYIQYAAL